MSDQIVGISVLQPIWIDGVYRLWFKAVKSSGEDNQGWIFIKDAASQGLPDRVPDYGDDSCNAIWKFARFGKRLDCHPSVNWISWGFHNDYSWSTDYIELSASEKSMSKAGPEPPRIHRGSAIHFDLNHTVGIDQAKLIEELKAQGAIQIG